MSKRPVKPFLVDYGDQNEAMAFDNEPAARKRATDWASDAQSPIDVIIVYQVVAVYDRRAQYDVTERDDLTKRNETDGAKSGRVVGCCAPCAQSNNATRRTTDGEGRQYETERCAWCGDETRGRAVVLVGGALLQPYGAVTT